MIRRALGPVAPTSPTSGALVTDAEELATSYTDAGLAAVTQYSYALFAHRGKRVATAATVTSTTTKAGSGSLSGTVTDAAGTLHGLAGVGVEVTNQSSYTPVYSATTAADGSYTVTGLEARTDYQVHFLGSAATGGSSDATGYIAEYWHHVSQFDGLAPTPVAVAPDVTTTGINAALVGGGAISGAVTDAAGTHQGLSNAEVYVTSSLSRATGYSVTATDGSYTVKGLPAVTDYQVRFSGSAIVGGSADATGYIGQVWQNQSVYGTPTPVVVTTGTTTSGISAALVGGAAISGTVTDAGGLHHGLANVVVSVYSASPGSGWSTTSADGSYIVTGLPAGADYEVCFGAADGTGGSSDASGYFDQCWKNQVSGTATPGTPTPVVVTPGANSAGIDAALAAAGAISGKVTDAGTSHGLANVGVSVYTADMFGGGGYATTTVDGSYTVKGLTAGTDYQVCFYASGATGGSADAIGYGDQCWQNQQPGSGSLTPVAVTLGATSAGIDAALVGSGAVSGTVTDAAGTHQGLANVWVSLSSPSTLAGGSAMTAADGSYTVTGIPAGADYQVCFSAYGATGGSSDLGGYVDQCPPTQPTSVIVTAGSTTTGVDAALTGAGTFTGTVTDAAGTNQGLGGVEVHYFSPSTGTAGDTWTSDDGSYTAIGVAAGTDYQVCFNAAYALGGSSATGYVDQCWQNQPTTGTPTPVTVTAGASVAGIDAALVGQP
jgi:hypothetical protein